MTRHQYMVKRNPSRTSYGLVLESASLSHIYIYPWSRITIQHYSYNIIYLST